MYVCKYTMSVPGTLTYVPLEQLYFDMYQEH